MQWILMQTKEGNRLAAPADKCTFHLPDKLPTVERAHCVTVIVMGMHEHVCPKEHVTLTEDFDAMLAWVG